jgi:hypothetical protein
MMRATARVMKTLLEQDIHLPYSRVICHSKVGHITSLDLEGVVVRRFEY